MDTYHKINAPFKRHASGPDKGKFIEGEWSVPEFEYLKNNLWEFTEKVDGTNIRIKLTYISSEENKGGHLLGVEYAGRSDNAVIPDGLMLSLEALFPTFPQWRRSLQEPPHRERYDEVRNWMRDSGLQTVVLYGEGYGPKIQGGGKYRPDASFVLFDVKINKFWLSRDNVNDVAANLGIESVPVIGAGSLEAGFDMVRNGLKSRWGDFLAEGVVAVPSVPLFARDGSRIITKIKTVDFR